MTDQNGEFDFKRVRALVSILLAVFAGAILIGVMAGMLPPPKSEVLLVGVGSMLLPITGGTIATGIVQAKRNGQDP